LPSATQPSCPARAASTFARSSAAVASCQFGPWWSASSSTCGTERRSARTPTTVVFPERLDPITAIIRPTADYGSAVLRRALLLGLALLAAGCGGTTTARTLYSSGLPPAEGRLDLIAFPGYAEAGGDDPRVNWVAPFVRLTGCKVRVRRVRSSTELLAAVAAGHFDGVTAFGDVTQVLTRAGQAVPVDTALIPNYRRIYPALRNLSQNREDGTVVGVPHGRGPDVLVWRTDRVRRRPAGWGVLFGTRYSGRIAIYDAAITLADAALQLGYRNPYELDPRQFRAVVRLGAEQSASVGLYWQDLTNALAGYTGGNALTGEATPRLVALLRADAVPVRAEVPAGGTARSASWMLLAGARHPGCMYRWLNYIISPRANAASARFLGEAPATPAACAYMDCAAVHAADEAWWSRLSFWRTPQHVCGDRRGDVCAGWHEWSDAWAQIRGG
jgi:putative spermidine/putrescine transport system substrate-binding protein